jgi:uncharacterized membrane protein YeiH
VPRPTLSWWVTGTVPDASHLPALSADQGRSGAATLAILPRLGGGLIRDTLLQHGPLVALTDSAYIPTALAGALLAYFLVVPDRLSYRAFPFIDALTLGCSAATGAQRTLSAGLK